MKGLNGEGESWFGWWCKCEMELVVACSEVGEIQSFTLPKLCHVSHVAVTSLRHIKKK